MNKKNITYRLYLMYALLLMPLVCFGLYKNGVRLYEKGYIDFISMFKPLILLLMAVCGGLVGLFIKSRKNIDLNLIKKCKPLIVESLIIASLLPLKSSPLILFLVMFALSFKEYKLINKLALSYLIVQGINYLLGLNTFSNIYEVNTVLNYDGFDLFIGLGTGGICSTSIVLILLSLIVLSFNKLYKKELVYSAIISFLILIIVPSMINANYDIIFSRIFGFNVLFCFVFMAPNIRSSCYTTGGLITSGILIGALTYFLMIIMPYNAAVTAILLVSPLRKIIDRVFIIK